MIVKVFVQASLKAMFYMLIFLGVLWFVFPKYQTRETALKWLFIIIIFAPLYTTVYYFVMKKYFKKEYTDAFENRYLKK